MMKILTASLAIAFAFAAVNAYACDEKNNSAKAEAGKANVEMTSANDGTCHSETGATKANAGACESKAKAMTAEVQKTGAEGCCPFSKGASAQKADADGACGSGAKAMTTEAKKVDAKSANCPMTPGCCDQKAKNSNASQKAEAPVEDTKDANPVLIMGSPASATSNQ